MAGGLRSLGLRPGDRAALVLPTSPDFYDAFFGTLFAGGVPVPLYPPVRLGRLDEYHERTGAMLHATRARVVLTNGSIRRVLGRSVEKAGPPLGCVDVREVSRDASVSVLPAPDDLALIQFSSGTTVAPKPVRLTHRQILSNVEVILDAITSLFPEEGFTHSGVSWLPLYHDMGLVGSVFTALARPRDLTLIPPELFVARPAIWLRTIARYRGTVSAAPNFAYNLCTEKIPDSEIEGLDLSSWRLALNGAEPVTPVVLERFVERFHAFGLRPEALTPVYGLAEAALAVCFSDPLRPFESGIFDRKALVDDGLARRALDGLKLVAVGKPLPGYAVKILKEDGVPARDGELGSVFVSGPSLMDAYEGLPELTVSVLRDGWLDTGDLGFVDCGELFLYGRKKDIVIVRGRKYAPQDIEQAASGVPGIRTGCVAAIGVVPEGGPSEGLVVLAEKKRGERADAALARAVRERVIEATGLVPDQVVVWPPGTLPRTSSGKIRRNEARRLYLEGRLRPPAAVSALRLFREMIRSRFALSRSRRHVAREELSS